MATMTKFSISINGVFLFSVYLRILTKVPLPVEVIDCICLSVPILHLPLLLFTEQMMFLHPPSEDVRGDTWVQKRWVLQHRNRRNKFRATGDGEHVVLLCDCQSAYLNCTPLRIVLFRWRHEGEWIKPSLKGNYEHHNEICPTVPWKKGLSEAPRLKMTIHYPIPFISIAFIVCNHHHYFFDLITLIYIKSRWDH